jgi:teichoic acid transport system permease protein
VSTDKTTTAAAAGPKRPQAPQPPAPVEPDMTSAERLAVAQQYGLKAMGVRPPLGAYIRDVTSRWAFIKVLGTSSAYAKHQNNYLGQLWNVLNPTLNAIVYIIIFGFLLNTNRGVSNAIAFIVIGTFLFRFVEQSVNAGAQSIARKTSLIRSLHFPRAILPISQVVSLLTTLLPALLVMCLFVLGSGLLPQYAFIPITWEWLLLPVVVLMMWVFNTGLAFIMARVVAITPDIDNVIGFFMRFAMYGSGVIFPVSHYASGHPALEAFLQYQPFAVYLYLGRQVLTQEKAFPNDPLMWILAVVWAVLFFVVGFIVFWRGEERYGRD